MIQTAEDPTIPKILGYGEIRTIPRCSLTLLYHQIQVSPAFILQTDSVSSTRSSPQRLVVVDPNL